MRMKAKTSAIIMLGKRATNAEYPIFPLTLTGFREACALVLSRDNISEFHSFVENHYVGDGKVIHVTGFEQSCPISVVS